LIYTNATYINRYASKFLLSGSSSTSGASTTSTDRNLKASHLSDLMQPSYMSKSLEYGKYDNGEYLSFNPYLGNISPPALFGGDMADMRHCFSASRNSIGTNNVSSSSASSSDMVSDMEEKRLIKSKGIVCLTDGSSTSFKFISNENNNLDNIHNNSNTNTNYEYKNYSKSINIGNKLLADKHMENGKYVESAK
jgi:hypothetical protein